MTGHICKQCQHYPCEVMIGDGEPMDDRGACGKRGKNTDADDYCSSFALSAWAKRKEEERGE